MSPAEIRHRMIQAAKARLASSRQRCPACSGGRFVSDGHGLDHGFVPIGIDVTPFGTDPTYILVTPPSGCVRIEGVRSFNQPGEIWVDSVMSREIRRAKDFDSATFLLPSTVPDMANLLPYYRVAWGEIDDTHPLEISFRRRGGDVGVPKSLSWTLYGAFVGEHEEDEFMPPLRDVAPPRREHERERSQEPEPERPQHPWGIPRWDRDELRRSRR